METDIPVFLAVEPSFLETARRELLPGFREGGNLIELPQPDWNNPKALVEGAEARGAKALVCMAGSKSPFGRKITELAGQRKIRVAFVSAVAPANLLGFASGWRAAQRDLVAAFANVPEEGAI